MAHFPEIVNVDGAAFAVRFRGFAAPMRARVPGGREIELQPWTCREHLSALEGSLKPTERGVRLDTRAYARAVLAASQVPDSLAEPSAPLALWWAAGGDAGMGAPDQDGWLVLGDVRVRLRAWTEGERLTALTNQLQEFDDGARIFNLVGYLEEMLRGSTSAIEPSRQTLYDLDSAATTALIAAVVALNVPGQDWQQELLQRLEMARPELAVNTLRICRALGRSPEEVWAMPARDIDRLLDLLDLADGVTGAPTGHSSGLASHPDAVIIQIEDAEP